MNYELVKLNTARNALKYVIKAFSVKELYMPYYICPTIRVAANKEDCKIVYYHIDNEFRPLEKFPKNSFILYPNYFGVCSDIVDFLSQQYENLIVDNAHSFFSKPKGIASFNSLRKFFPNLRDGSFLYTKKVLDLNFLQDDFNYNPYQLSYEELCKNENRLNSQEIKYISNSTLNAYSSINIEQEKVRRIKLFNYINRYFNLNYKLSKNDIPMSYPYFAKNSNEAKQIVDILQKDNITVYRYWNNMPKSYPEYALYENLLVISLNVGEFDFENFNPE